MASHNGARLAKVVVITGASSGIGRETALRLGQRGASVVLAARNETALREAAKEVERAGGQAEVVPTDVSVSEQVENLARRAAERFGRIDAWVNNAAVSIYATVEDMTIEEIDRVINVNPLGQIYEMKAAVAQMRRQGHGTIVNVASALAERAVPLQAAYCASKHGIKGFSEALRLELKRDSAIEVVLVEPSSINTPLFANARSKLGKLPMPIPPIYEPGMVAETIIEAIGKPKRDLAAGGSGKMFTLMQRLSPSLLDWYMLQNDRMFKQQVSDKPDDGEDNLFSPSKGPGSTTGDFGEKSKATSLYTRHLELHPQRKLLLLTALTLGLLRLTRGRKGA